RSQSPRAYAGSVRVFEAEPSNEAAKRRVTLPVVEMASGPQGRVSRSLDAGGDDLVSQVRPVEVTRIEGLVGDEELPHPLHVPKRHRVVQGLDRPVDGEDALVL